MLNKILSTVILAAGIGASALDVYISPSGNDANDGRSAKNAVATLNRAQQILGSSTDKQNLCHLGGGTYLLTESVKIGPGQNNTTYRPLPGQEVRLVGGVLIPPSAMSKDLPGDIRDRLPEDARKHVVMIDLKKLGIKHVGPYRDLFGNQEDTDNGGVIDLYFNGRRLQAARWPNEGYTTMGEVMDNGDPRAKRGGAFQYRTDRPSNWTKAVESGLWLRGFWRVPWVCQSVRVGEIDPAKKTIRHAVGISGGIGSKYTATVNGLRKGDGKELFYAFNLPEELDLPGEWYLDSKSEKLYFWPPADLKGDSLLISDLAAPVVEINGADNITVQSLTFEGGLREALAVRNSKNVKILGNTFRNTGAQGVKLTGGSDNEIRSNDFYQIGGVPIEVNAGDRRTLTPGNVRIVNNHLRNFGEVVKISNGMEIDGVGQYVANNLIHDGNYGGIQYRGNNHLFEYNEMHSLGQDGGDYGVFYSNADWSSAGNVIRRNFAHHITGNFSYMDDGHSGDKTLENLNYKVAAGLFWGGGHNNTAHGNIFVDNEVAMHVDSRGVARKYDINSRVHMANFKKYAENNPVYAKAYPEMSRLPYDKSTLPTGNLISGNYAFGCAKAVRLGGKEADFQYMTVKDNPEKKSTAIFVNPPRFDFSLKPGAKVPEGMRWIGEAFPKMGLQQDEFRKTLPARMGKTKDNQRVFDSTVDMDASNRIEKK